MSTGSSPTTSITDLRDETESYDGSLSRKSRRKLGGLDIDDIDHTVHTIQQDAVNVQSNINELRSQSQNQSRRIHDLQLQFEEARARLDKLKRKGRSRSEYGFDTANIERRTSDAAPNTSDVSIDLPKEGFSAVTVTLKVEDE